ncbi:MAG: hypothetical protein PHQ96_08735 [Candidatus Omnitrophica bacterium]|nr:hypothetical protein [Candidatus Omnitrophota bacterium]
MKHAAVIIIAALVVSTLSLPAFCDTIILKSGKSVEGKILTETDEYVTIDYSGIPLKYWKEDIAQINKEVAAKARKFYAERSASNEKGVLKITLKEDPAYAVSVFIKSLDAAKTSITKTANNAQGGFASAAGEDISPANRKFFKETAADIKKQADAIDKLIAPPACRALQKYALKIADVQSKRFSGVTDNFTSVDELKDYWEQFSAVTIERLSKKYDKERERILTKYAIELPPAS